MNKNIIVDYIQSKLSERKTELELAIKNAQEAANSESKSSAGDKYETARAMAQNDIDMYKTQLLEVARDQNTFNNINFEIPFDKVNKGALVKTNIGLFFVGISFGKVQIQNQNIIMVSAESPIGAKLLHAKWKDMVEFNQQKIEIMEVC